MVRKALFVCVGLIGIAVMLSGCVAAAAGAAAGVGTYSWARGRLSFNTDNTSDEVHKAARSAYEDLDIRLERDDYDNLAGTLKGTTTGGESVTVDIEPQASNVTKIDVRVGFWGNRAQSEKVATKIMNYL